MTATPDLEQRIDRMVHRFYELGDSDPLLGPVFRAIPDRDGHLRTVVDFWSANLLGTGRYHGNAFGVHMRLPIEPDSFDRWVAVLDQAAGETLPPDLAARAVGQAKGMAECFKIGLFPWRDADGKPCRRRPVPAG